ncbi:MAG TPA: hypothetical protein VNF27_07695 [Candidatus Binataceae bacterium]|nr:hypothetical protein [Candidatus Binataceae bacterium]
MNLVSEKREQQSARPGDSVRVECDRPDPWLNVGFAPDFLVPAQYYDLTRRRSGLDGETRLVYAVLEDAVRCYVKNAGASHGMRRALFDEVQGWFHARTAVPGPFSFAYVCDVLEVDPDYLRTQLAQLGPDDLPTKQMRSVGRRHVVRSGRRSSGRRRARAREAAAE